MVSKFKDVQSLWTQLNRDYNASILFEYKQKVGQKELNNFVGLDFLMHELYVASDNTSVFYPRFYRQAKEKIFYINYQGR